MAYGPILLAQGSGWICPCNYSQTAARDIGTILSGRPFVTACDGVVLVTRGSPAGRHPLHLGATGRAVDMAKKVSGG